jgi:hypothetical protein
LHVMFPIIGFVSKDVEHEILSPWVQFHDLSYVMVGTNIT